MGNGIIEAKGGDGLEQSKKRDHKIMITDIAISKVPYVEVPGLSRAVCEAIQQEHKELLQIAKAQNDSNEVLVLRLMDGTRKESVLGGEFGVDPSTSPEACSLYSSSGYKQLMYLHNHPSTNKFSFADIMEFVRNGPIGLISVVTNQGEVHILYKSVEYSFRKSSSIFNEIYQRYMRDEIEHTDAVKMFLTRCREGGIIYAKSN